MMKKVRTKQDLIDIVSQLSEYEENMRIEFSIPSYYLLKLDKQLWYDHSTMEYPYDNVVPWDKIIVTFENINFTINGNGNYQPPDIKTDEFGNSFIE
jgi:hypothetical protein